MALAGAAMAVLGAPRVARADVSSWLFIGSGPSWLQRASQDPEYQPSLQMETGLGSSPRDLVVLGGLGRVHTHFGQGTDLGLLIRSATRGLVRGDWGAALDVGAYERFWGVGSTGALLSLSLGAPWGITLSLTGGIGTNDSKTISAVIGLDLARATIYRQSGENWWENPFPPEKR
jgi:hypothetical protein